LVTKDELAQHTAIANLDQPWDTLFVQAPVVISLLGQLTVISGQVDFGLDISPPVGGFKHVRQPSSFRAILSQVGHDAWHAFQVR